MAEPICTAPELLSALNSREALFSFLRSKLSWNVDPEDPFTYDDLEAVGRAAAHADLSRILPFSSGDPFVIFLVEFKERFRRGDLRDILRGIRKRIREEAAYQTGAYKTTNFDDLVFVCTVPDGLRFVHFEERENRQPKLRLFGFDRDTVDETYTLRTINLPSLRLTTNLLGEVDWNACKANWKAAWDVERVTKLFYRDYRDVFFDVEANHVKNAPGDKRLFVQRFFNRLMFLHFLSKKGWLRAPGKAEGDTGREYLHDLWNEYTHRQNRYDGETFYQKHLAPLFFFALNEPYIGRDDEMLSLLVGKVPYLNGGLFEKTDDDKAAFTIEDAAFTKIWDNLFACYNFTVAESTPDDQDVAVDPEMLGKVFEELVTGRHESGSYYTPRPVVQFMCREALKGYLAPCGAGVDKLVDFHDPQEITNDEAVLSALKAVKVVDPACGSGAYLLGMLQELMALRLALFNKDAKSLDAKTTYERKLEIIQNCLYGVDLDPFAVNTARLRLWLSLVVEDGRNALVPDAQTDKLPEVALPNLDFKIEIGDSVSCPDPTGGLQQDMFRQSDLRVLGELQHRHGDVRYTGNKAALKAEIDALARTIKKQSGLDETAFDWRVDFGPAFSHPPAPSLVGTREGEKEGEKRGSEAASETRASPNSPSLVPTREGAGGWEKAQVGFDIVLANPPYVRGELIKNLKPTLKRVYGDRFGGTMDLYCFFYFRAIELLKKGGQLVFITPNKWFRAGYGAKLRETIAQTCQVRSITDFGELPVFETAATFPMIFVAQKGHDYEGEATFTQVKTLNAPYPDVKAVIAASGFTLPSDAIRGSEWSLTASHVSDRLRQMERAGVPLGEYVGGKIYYGIKTGFNDAFVIKGEKRDELIAADPNSADLIKPLAVGDDIRRWRIENQGEDQKYIIVTKIGVPIAKYPAIFKHLSQWEPELQKRGDKGNHWWELRPCAYYDIFDGPKIHYPEIAREPRFTFDNTGIFPLKTAFTMPSSDLYLLGILNSASAWDYLKKITSVLGDEEQGGRLTLQTIFVEKLPIPNATDEQKSEIAALVQQCLNKPGQGVVELEAQINERVARLYFSPTPSPPLSF